MVENIAIYLDESGDLGFNWQKKKIIPYFIITLLVCKGRLVIKGINKAVSRTLKNKINHKANKKQLMHELKGSHTDFKIKDYFYRHFPQEEWGLYTIVLNKRRVYKHLQTSAGKKKLYNFLAKFLIDQIKFPSTLKTLQLVVDKCKNTNEIKDFNFYLEPQLEVRFDIAHALSNTHYALQAVDLFC
ncbi:MAG: hypothetical protein Tsb005_20100 [Gammaproteobacteria bacterium]